MKNMTTAPEVLCYVGNIAACENVVIAVLPGGLDEIYLKSNRKLAEQIVKNGGCLISEYPERTKPQRYTYVQRDKIQAMLSNKVFVVDSEIDGGTMHTAEFAIKMAKPLGCLAEKDGKSSPKGNQYLIGRKVASAIFDTEDLMKFVGQPEYEQFSLFE